MPQRRQALMTAAHTPRYPSVFISYSRKDKAVAKALADDLDAAGVPVWWDREIYPGDDFHNAIVTALDQAQVVIVIWSEDAAASPWVRDEARRAARQKKLITVHVPGFDPADIPLGFGDHHSESIEDRDRLIAALVARRPSPLRPLRNQCGCQRNATRDCSTVAFAHQRCGNRARCPPRAAASARAKLPRHAGVQPIFMDEALEATVIALAIGMARCQPCADGATVVVGRCGCEDGRRGSAPSDSGGVLCAARVRTYDLGGLSEARGRGRRSRQPRVRRYLCGHGGLAGCQPDSAAAEDPANHVLA